METDKLLYILFQQYPASFFELIGRRKRDARLYTFTSVELKDTALRLDGLFLSKVTGESMYVVEAQFQRDRNFYARLFSEIFLYLKQYRFDGEWTAVVVYPSRKAEQANLGAYQELLTSSRVRRIYLDELPGVPELDATIGLYKLVVEPEARAPQSARTLIQKAPDYLDIVQQILAYKFSTRSPEEIRAMLNIKEELLKDTRYFREIAAQAQEEGMTKGIQEGLQKGLREGEEKKAKEIARALLNQGLSAQKVAEVTGLTLQKVKGLSTPAKPVASKQTRKPKV